MKTLLLLALVGLAIAFPVRTLAQEQNAVAPQVRQQIETVFQQFQEAYNNHDAATIAGLHTQDAIEIRTSGGAAFGREAIGKRSAEDLAGNPGKMVNKVAQLYAIGSDICVISNESVGQWMGDAVKIYVRQFDGWKIRMAYVH